MRIRPESATDESAIADITAQAFAQTKHSDGSEPTIIAGLRAPVRLRFRLSQPKETTSSATSPSRP